MKSRVPALGAEGWFTEEGDAPALVGNRCTSCGTVFFPAVSFFCRNPDCAGTEFTETELSRIEHSSVHTGRKPGYLRKITRHQWQASQRYFINDSPESGVVVLNQRTFRGHLHLLEDSCEPKVDLDALDFCDGNVYPPGDYGSEARLTDVKFIAAGS